MATERRSAKELLGELNQLDRPPTRGIGCLPSNPHGLSSNPERLSSNPPGLSSNLEDPRRRAGLNFLREGNASERGDTLMTSMEHLRALLPRAVGAEETGSRAKRGEQFAEGARLEKEIRKNLRGLGYGV